MIYTEYETIYIVKPEVTDDVLRNLQEKIKGIIERYQGEVLVLDDWGKRKLAYPILKNQRGHFVYFNYVGPSSLVAEVERNLRIEDNLMRFLTVRLDEDVDVAAKRVAAEEMLRRRAEAAARRAAEAAEEDERDDDYGDDDEQD